VHQSDDLSVLIDEWAPHGVLWHATGEDIIIIGGHEVLHAADVFLLEWRLLDGVGHEPYLLSCHGCLAGDRGGGGGA